MEDMQHQMMGYDRAATMFSPDGHILQVEYAEKTIRLGASSVGMVCKDGVIIVAAIRIIDKLVEEDSTNKIFEIDSHVMASAAGIISDARVLIEKARISAQQHRIVYDSDPTTESVVNGVADVKQQFTQFGGGRPFGVALLIGGFDTKPEIYATDVTGNYLQYKASAIGENDEKIRERLREKYKEGLSCEQGVKLILEIFKEIQSKDFNIEKFDIGMIKENKKIKKLSKEEIKKLQ